MNGSRFLASIAARRVLYPASVDGSVGVILADIPAAMRGQDLLLGRFYYWLFENDAERAEIEAWIATAEARSAGEVAGPVMSRASAHADQGYTFIRLEAPGPGWPYLLVVRWPAAVVEALIAQDPSIAVRGRYTMEAYRTEAELFDESARMARSIATPAGIEIKILHPADLRNVGRA